MLSRPVLPNGMNTTVWQTNIANQSISSVVMQDNDNFILKNNSSNIVWESFVNPTDTLLVNQTFGVGQSLHMYPYSFTLESSGNFTLKWRKNITYWNQGAPNGSRACLNNQGFFTLFNSSHIQIWIAYNNDYTDASITLQRIMLESDGNLRSYGWFKSEGPLKLGWSAIKYQFQVYGWCGNFGVCVYNHTSSYCMCPSTDFVPIDPNDPTQGCNTKEDIAGCHNHSRVVLSNTVFFSYPPESESRYEIYNFDNTYCEQNYRNNLKSIGEFSLLSRLGT